MSSAAAVINISKLYSISEDPDQQTWIMIRTTAMLTLGQERRHLSDCIDYPFVSRLTHAFRFIFE